MTAVAKYLARNLNVLLGKQLVLLRHDPAGWVGMLESGEMVSAGAVILTPPVPQSLALLDAGRIELPTETRARLEGIEYESCLAVMASLDGPAQIPRPGSLAPTGGPIAWIADNQMKGVSATPAVTIHATADFSLENWDRDRQESGRGLLQAAEPWLGSGVIEFQVHGWRYSKPVRTEESTCLDLERFAVVGPCRRCLCRPARGRCRSLWLGGRRRPETNGSQGHMNWHQDAVDIGTKSSVIKVDFDEN